jgi:hypothetical protein
MNLSYPSDVPGLQVLLNSYVGRSLLSVAPSPGPEFQPFTNSACGSAELLPTWWYSRGSFANPLLTPFVNRKYSSLSSTQSLDV